MTLHTLAPWLSATSPIAKRRSRLGLYDDFDRLVNGLFDNFIESTPEQVKAGKKFDFTPSLNMEDSEEAYKLTLEIPGTRKEDLHIEVHENQLLISGEKKVDYDEKKEGSHYIGRSYGKFERRVALSQDVDKDNIQAEVKDGLLTVIIPKSIQKKDQVRKLDIK